jgi:hypothetical protein
MATFKETLDPATYGPYAQSPTYLVTALQDELFTIDAARATYEALLTSGKPVYWDILPNFDHNVFFNNNNFLKLCKGFPNGCFASVRTEGNLGYALMHGFNPTAVYRPLQPTLVATADPAAQTITFTADVDRGSTSVALGQVKVWISADRGCTTTSTDGIALDCSTMPNGLARCSKTIAYPGGNALDSLLYFADVGYSLAAWSSWRTQLDGLNFKECPGSPQSFNAIHLSTPAVLPTAGGPFLPALRPDCGGCPLVSNLFNLALMM